MNAGVSENISEKPKRGRPRSYERELADNLGKLAICTTVRGRTNEAFRVRAFGVLKEVDWDNSYLMHLPGGNLRGTILTELGRLGDDDLILEWARVICERKITTRRAVTLLRDCRLGRETRADADQLCSELTRLLDDYMRRYPDCTFELMQEAFTGAQETVSFLVERRG